MIESKIDHYGRVAAAERCVRNLEFRITFTGTNMRYLASEHGEVAAALVLEHTATIKDLDKELQLTKTELRVIRGF